jgi:hypothetical protein
MKTKKSTIAIALAILCTSSFAMTDDEGGVWFGTGSGANNGGVTGGYGGYAELPPVEVTCGLMCRDLGVTSSIPGYSIVTMGRAPIPQDPRGGGGVNEPPNPPPATPEEEEKKKKDCLEKCDVSNKVKLNNCAIQVEKARATLRNRPYYAAGGGAIAGFIAAKIGGALVGAGSAYELVGNTNEKLITNLQTTCQGEAAQDNNTCIQQTCHAWFLAPLIMLRRRREENDEA